MSKNWQDVRAQAIAQGLDEARIEKAKDSFQASVRAQRLAEIRRTQSLTQADVAATMHVAQPRVSAIENGHVSATEVGTIRAYIEALGGKLQLVAAFPDASVIISD